MAPNAITLIVVLLALLAGCAAPLHSVNGEAVDAPYGYSIYCARHPDRAECGK